MLIETLAGIAVVPVEADNTRQVEHCCILT